MQLFSYQAIQTQVLGAQKNRLIETVLLSTHNICFGWEIRKIIFSYLHISGSLDTFSAYVISTTILRAGSKWRYWNIVSCDYL